LELHIHYQEILSVKEAEEVQSYLSRQVAVEDKYGEVNLVCGVNVGFKGSVAVAAISILSFPDLKLLERVTAETEVILHTSSLIVFHVMIYKRK
jgi:deoxyinosine 3'endonuclease (endonuclease V)